MLYIEILITALTFFSKGNEMRQKPDTQMLNVFVNVLISRELVPQKDTLFVHFDTAAFNAPETIHMKLLDKSERIIQYAAASHTEKIDVYVTNIIYKSDSKIDLIFKSFLFAETVNGAVSFEYVADRFLYKNVSWVRSIE